MATIRVSGTASFSFEGVEVEVDVEDQVNDYLSSELGSQFSLDDLDISDVEGF